MQDTHSTILLSSLKIGQMHINLSYSNGISVVREPYCLWTKHTPCNKYASSN